MLTLAQKEKRMEGIGGSDSPTVMGVNPWKTPMELWEEKRGLRPEPEISPAMQRGIVLEDTVAKLYAEKTGRKLRRVNETLTHPDYDWMLAHLDRQIIGDDRGPGVLEIKCPGLQVFNKCKREGLPNYMGVQLQHYLAVSGRSWGAFAVFNSEKWEMIFFDIDADPEIQNIIIARDWEFWQLVRDGVPPAEIPMEAALDLPTIGPHELLTVDDPLWKISIDKLREATAIRKEADLLEEEAKKDIQNMMTHSGANVVQGFGSRIYWKLQDGRTTFDKKRLAKDHPEIDLTAYEKKGSPFKVFKPYFLREANNE